MTSIQSEFDKRNTKIIGLSIDPLNAQDALNRATVNGAELIQRHQSGDWGNVPPLGDAEENNRSAANGWRILSS